MHLPVIRGLIDRRILVNYRVRPEALCRVLPEPFRPLLVGGMGMAGICLIRLTHVRPRLVPGWLGLGSENAAHRIAVEWDCDGERREGVYIPRRDTSSRLNRLIGGRLFPGFHHLAKFDVRESDGRYQIALDSDDGRTHLAIDARIGRPPAVAIGVSIARRGVGIFSLRRTRIFRHADAGRIRRVGTEELELVDRAVGDRPCRIELFRRCNAISARLGRIRLGLADAPHRTRMARAGTDGELLCDVTRQRRATTNHDGVHATAMRPNTLKRELPIAARHFGLRAHYRSTTSTNPTSIPCPPVVWWQWTASVIFAPGFNSAQRRAADFQRFVRRDEAPFRGGGNAVDINLDIFVVKHAEMQIVKRRPRAS